MVAKTLVLICVALGVLALLSSCGGGGPTSGDISTAGRISTDVVDELQPGTTLHMVEVHYQRHGPADEELKLSESYQPETLRNESWTTFDKNGKLTAGRSESRTPDGKLYASNHLENGKIVVDKGKQSDFQSSLAGITVDIMRQRFRDALAEERAAIAAQPNAPIVTIRGTKTLQIEQSRHPWTFQQSELGPGDYVSTYVYDLHPAEEARREYALPDGSYTLRAEWVAIDADGKETVIESWDHLVFEVLKS